MFSFLYFVYNVHIRPSLNYSIIFITWPMWLKLMYLMHNTKTMVYYDPLTIRVCVWSHARGRGTVKWLMRKINIVMISNLWENIQNIFWDLFQGLKKSFLKAKIVLWVWNVQFPILCTYKTIFKLFYHLYYTAYMTEIDIFDAQYKDND